MRYFSKYFQDFGKKTTLIWEFKKQWQISSSTKKSNQLSFHTVSYNSYQLVVKVANFSWLMMFCLRCQMCPHARWWTVVGRVVAVEPIPVDHPQLILHQQVALVRGILSRELELANIWVDCTKRPIRSSSIFSNSNRFNTETEFQVANLSCRNATPTIHLHHHQAYLPMEDEEPLIQSGF